MQKFEDEIERFAKDMMSTLWKVKYETIQELETGVSLKLVAARCGITKRDLPAWKKIKWNTGTLLNDF